VAPPFDIVARSTSLVQWILHALAVAGFSVLTAITISNLRNRLLRGIAEQEAAGARLEQLAFYDQLTGLPNRTLFRRHIEERISAGISQGTVVIVDLRRFRLFNSLYGTARGDELLAAFGSLLQSYRSDEDVFTARLSGDEFAGWVEEWDPERLERNIARLRTDISAKLSELGAEYVVDYYVAAASYPSDGSTADRLLAHVSIALRSAKDHGSSTLVRFTGAMAAIVETDHELAAGVRRGLAHDEFYPVYQTKVELSSDRVVGVEALARWDNAAWSHVGPDQFIPALIQTNRMVPFSERMMERVLSDYPRIQKQWGVDTGIAINVSHRRRSNYIRFEAPKLLGSHHSTRSSV
jgi:diguanylate cyclase (GGDEF)-like protein